jgi:hypothetical protein
MNGMTASGITLRNLEASSSTIPTSASNLVFEDRLAVGFTGGVQYFHLYLHTGAFRLPQ